MAYRRWNLSYLLFFLFVTKEISATLRFLLNRNQYSFLGNTVNKSVSVYYIGVPLPLTLELPKKYITIDM